MNSFSFIYFISSIFRSRCILIFFFSFLRRTGCRDLMSIHYLNGMRHFSYRFISSHVFKVIFFYHHPFLFFICFIPFFIFPHFFRVVSVLLLLNDYFLFSYICFISSLKSCFLNMIHLFRYTILLFIRCIFFLFLCFPSYFLLFLSFFF